MAVEGLLILKGGFALAKAAKDLLPKQDDKEAATQEGGSQKEGIAAQK